ncbi:MAG: hypothetical protein GX119_07270 [Syntrophomonadaceae bacterium]|jgi:hypothetical protein|nr:hypothetical protein [Syntrophomonadaceae bacterium]
MINYSFEIVKAEQIKGHKIAKTKDYQVKVLVKKDEKTIFDEVVNVRKNVQGIFPEMDLINKKIKAASTKKELLDQIKSFVKKAR